MRGLQVLEADTGGREVVTKTIALWKEEAAWLALLLADIESKQSTVGKDEMWWDELFSTEKDWMVMDCARLELDGKVFENIELRSQYERLELEGVSHDLNIKK